MDKDEWNKSCSEVARRSDVFEARQQDFAEAPPCPSDYQHLSDRIDELCGRIDTLREWIHAQSELRQRNQKRIAKLELEFNDFKATAIFEDLPVKLNTLQDNMDDLQRRIVQLESSAKHPAQPDPIRFDPI